MTKTNLAEYGSFVADAERREKWIHFLIYIGLAAGTFAAYEPIRHNSFVSYDDTRYITENPNVNGGITRQSVIWAFTTFHAANWHPLTWLSHTLDRRLFGLNPFWHHFTSLLFHIANALLLFWILNSLTGTLWPSAFVAAVFALHPLQVESVAWVAERKTVLSGLFWFLTIGVYIWYTKRPGVGRYISVLLVYALSVMTKPVVVTLPLVLLLLDYWPLERLNWGSPSAGKTVPAGRLIIEKIPLLVLSAILSVTTLIAQQIGEAVVTLEKMPLDRRIANIFISYIKYIWQMIWPSGLAVFYPHPHVNLSNTVVVVCALLFVLITVFSIYIGRRRRYVAVGWLWYVGTLVPMVGLVQVGSQAMADRYMYISMLGLLIIAAWAVKDLIANRPRWRVITAVLAGVMLLSAIILTRMQVRHWQNSITLFEHTLKVTENNALAENNYGCFLSEAGKHNEAVVHLRNALRIDPLYSNALNNLGKVFLKQGKLNEAISCFNLLSKLQKDSAEVYYNLAVALSAQSKYEEAIKWFNKVLALDPKYPNVHYRMGVTLLAAGKPNEAIENLKEGLQTRPGQAEVYVNLGTAYSQLGKYEQAIQSWTRAAELEPNNPKALNNLAWLLATTDDTKVQNVAEALALAQRVCESTDYKGAESLDTLAAAYAAAGKFPDAVVTAEKALNAAKAAGQEDLAREIQNRLELYQTGRPYRGK